MLACARSSRASIPHFASAALDTSIQECRTVFYTPPVTGAPGRIEKEVLTLFAAFSYLVEAANQRHQGKDGIERLHWVLRQEQGERTSDDVRPRVVGRYPARKEA
jgi:hypothetical protein